MPYRDPSNWSAEVWAALSATALWTFLYALFGRLLHHASLVQDGSRRFFSMALLLEFPIALAMGYVGAALAIAFNVSPAMQPGIIVGVSYIGPKVIKTGFAYVQKKLGVTKSDLENAQ